MAESSPVVVVVLVVVAAVGAVPVAALAGPGVPAQQTATDTATDESANESLAPGARFAGVVGVQQADVQGEIEARAFGQQVAAARSNRSAAGVVAGEVAELETRLAELDAEIRELERAHENGTVSDGEYRARLAQVHAKQRAVERRLNQTAAVAESLPEAALEAKGVNVTAIRTLRSRASELTGPEVAEIARGIAGKGAGKGMGGPPEDAGPPAFVENRTGPPGDRGNGTGPPEDAGPENETGPPEDAGPGNETGPPEDAGPENETGPPEDAGSGNETGPPEDTGSGNETGPPEDTGSENGTGPAGDGQGPSDDTGAGNETDGSGDGAGSAGAGNETSGDDAAGGSGGGSGSGSDGGAGADGGAEEQTLRSLVAPAGRR